MAFEYETRAAARLLGAVEDATLSTDDTRGLIEDADPALVYLLFAWLRARYGAGHPASEGVLGRIVELCGHASVAKAVRAGEGDAIVEWFQETYDYRDLDRDEFVSLVVEKLEG